MNLVAAAPAWLAWVFAALLVAAAAQDAATLRISNVIVGLVLVAAMVAAFVVGPDAGLWQNALVSVSLLAVGIPLFAAGTLGGGDVKLLAATGLWFDLEGALRLLVAVFVAGGILAILVIALRFFGWSETARRRVQMLRPKAGVPYAVAIAAGTLLSLGMQRAV